MKPKPGKVTLESEDKDPFELLEVDVFFVSLRAFCFVASRVFVASRTLFDSGIGGDGGGPTPSVGDETNRRQAATVVLNRVSACSLGHALFGSVIRILGR
jgi:hypothetical protein